VEKNSTNVDESYFVTNVENKLDEKVTLWQMCRIHIVIIAMNV
jgi:hypothetical protein